MSAWITSDAHCTALAVYAVRNKLTERTVLELARIMYEENCKSVDFRYSEYNERNFVLCSWASFHQFTPHEMYKAAACYAYQSCEHESWEKSESFRVVTAIKAHVLLASGITKERLTRSNTYEAAAWGIEAPQESVAA